MIHQKLNRTALMIAYKAAVSVAVPRLGNARRPDDEITVCPVVVERTKAGEVHARLAEIYEVAHNILNLCTVNDSLYYFVRYFRHKNLS